MWLSSESTSNEASEELELCSVSQLISVPYVTGVSCVSGHTNPTMEEEGVESRICLVPDGGSA